MTASGPGLTSKGWATRSRLLARAREQAISGEGTLELTKVAEAAGVVPSVVYRYFDSKAGLVSALVEDFFDRLEQCVVHPDLSARGGWVQRAHERLRLGVGFHFEEPLALVLYAQLGREPEVAAAQNRRTRAVIAHAAATIRDAQHAGDLRHDADPLLAAAASFGALREVLVEALSRPQRPAQEQIVELVWRQFAAALRFDPDLAAQPA